MSSALLRVAERVGDRAKHPLRYWRPSSEPQDYLIREFYRGVYCYASTANRGGKGEGIGASILALMLGLDSLNGYQGKRLDLWRGPIVVPKLKPPIIGILSGESYKAMSIASIATLRKLLGSRDPETWKEEHAGNPDYVSLFRIKHADAKDESEWSKLYVFPYDGALPEGAGLDFWWCDEPPPVRFLSTLSTRVAAGRRLRQVITATPQERAKWYPISRDFAEVMPNGHLQRWPDREVHGNRMRIKWPVRANEALGDEAIKQLESNAKGKPFEKSILTGEEVETGAACPWDAGVLQRAVDQAPQALRIERLSIEIEASGETRPFDLQVFEEWERGEPCYVAGDPAKGGPTGDPDGMHVRSCVTDRYKARLVGRIGAWGLGNLMADMSERYGDAICDPLVTGGYGIATVQALKKRGRRMTHPNRVQSANPMSWELGTTETEKIKAQMIEAFDRQVLDGSFLKSCPPIEVVYAMQDCHVDENGKVVQIGRKHLPEDLSCAGAYAVWSQGRIRPKVEPPKPARLEAPKVLTFAELMAAQNGTPKPHRNGNSRPRAIERIEGP